MAERTNNDLSVTDFAGAGNVGDRFNNLLADGVIDGDLNFRFGHEINAVLGTAVGFGVASLAPKALNLGHRNALDAQIRNSDAHFIGLEGFDDGGDPFNGAKQTSVVERDPSSALQSVWKCRNRANRR